MSDTAGCRLTVIHAAPTDGWQEARRRCEQALAQGCSFVLMTYGMQAHADESLLLDEDRQRAARFRRPADRHNFVLGRTLVHHLLRPVDAAVPYGFLRGPHGKPFLPDTAAYNISHSGRWLACAVSPREPIGIDVETFEQLGDYRQLLPSIAHPDERRCIEMVPAHQRRRLFQRCWTRKEAVLKAIGTGLSERLQGIDVRLDQDEPMLDDPAPLRLLDLPLGERAITAALAQAPSIPAVLMLLVSAGRPAAEGADLQNSRRRGEALI